MMDGRIAAIRAALDGPAHRHGTARLRRKYASAFYGPFRDAVDSSLDGDRRTYQQDPANRAEALRGGARPRRGRRPGHGEAGDGLPRHPRRRGRARGPVAAYQVSEVLDDQRCRRQGWIDRRSAVLESLTSIRRAGASIVLTYWAAEVAGWVKWVGRSVTW